MSSRVGSGSRYAEGFCCAEPFVDRTATAIVKTKMFRRNIKDLLKLKSHSNLQGPRVAGGVVGLHKERRGHDSAGSAQVSHIKRIGNICEDIHLWADPRIDAGNVGTRPALRQSAREMLQRK